MEKITNEQKAREICGCGNCHHNFKGNECLKYTGILCCLKPCFKATLEAMQWKDEQFAKEKQTLIQKYEDKLNKLNQREEVIRDNVRRANSRYGFEGLF